MTAATAAVTGFAVAPSRWAILSISTQISPLAALDGEALWRAARDRLPTDAAERLESLGQKRQREGLTEAEVREAATLIRQYERVMLVRAHAAALLKQRGHDVSSLLTAA